VREREQRNRSGIIWALLRLYSGSIKALLRLC
jgi:hypothetical protein